MKRFHGILLVEKANNSRLAKKPAEKKVGVNRGQFILLDGAAGLVPLVEPIDDSEQRKSGRTRSKQGFAALLFLDARDEALEIMDVLALARVDFFMERSFERPIFVEDNRDFKVARPHNQVDVADDRLSELFTGVGNILDFIENRLLQDVHAVVHDFVEEVVLTYDVMIQTGFSKAHGIGDF